ncbi:MAG: tetratricopeptide repeat protein [Ahniella sp.]|nr:tetratricopeptide repeat protein [Ahniella sp.]
MKLFAELKRRNVIRMAGLYLVAAWLVVQVAGTLLPMFHAPPWIARSVVILLVVGFLPALVISWIFELTPEGLKRESDLIEERRAAPGMRRFSDRNPDQRPPQNDNKLLDRWIIVILSTALAFFAIERLLRAPTAAPTARPPVTLAGPAVHAGDLVAVLPFRNRSKLVEDAYFAEGVHDDLLTQLSKVSGFKVISRTSMMRYLDSKQSIPEIARELGAAVVLEGAVQRAGDRVRITVQLIDGSSDVHLWAETYDRALTTSTMFSIQADIARVVADAMKVVLSPAETTALRTGPTSNIQAYDAFLQGKLLAALDRATPERFSSALAHFERAIALDPKFAEAHARKARIQLASYWFAYADATQREAARVSVARARELADAIETKMAEAYFHYWGELDYARAEATLQQILERAPDYAEAWYARALVARRDGRFDDSINALKRSLANDPANSDTLLELRNTLATVGRRRESVALEPRLKKLGLEVASHGAEDAFNAGKVDAAWTALDGPNDFYATLPFRIALASGKADRIAEALSEKYWPQRLREFPDYPEVHALATAEAQLVLGQTAQARASLLAIQKRLQAREVPYPGRWSSSGSYFYYPCDLPGMLADLEGVRAAERDYRENTPRDVWAEGGVRASLAVAYARAGDQEAALDHLEALTRMFGPVTFTSIGISPGLASLHQHPRFLALAEGHKTWQARESVPAVR